MIQTTLYYSISCTETKVGTKIIQHISSLCQGTLKYWVDVGVFLRKQSWLWWLFARAKLNMFLFFSFQGVLLYGPPGTGKTLLARAVAHHTECTFIRVSGSELVQKFIGEGARMVRELFVMAR